MIETIKYNNLIIAIIIYGDYQKDGISFITPPEFSLQLGYLNHPAGHRIVPHVHNPIHRETIGTQEVLFIKSGSIKIDFYSSQQKYLESRTLSARDMVLLASGGHGIEILEPTIMFEVKNGPYLDDMDKVRFEGEKDKLE